MVWESMGDVVVRGQRAMSVIYEGVLRRGFTRRMLHKPRARPYLCSIRPTTLPKLTERYRSHQRSICRLFYSSGSRQSYPRAIALCAHLHALQKICPSLMPVKGRGFRCLCVNQEGSGV